MASFLLDMGPRAEFHGYGMPAYIALPMSRANIADRLGLTVETVSRTLLQLQCDSDINVAGAHIGICDRADLAACAAP